MLSPDRSLSAATHNSPLPLLQTARQVQSLSQAEAERGYPVHIARAQVTYFQASLGLLFLTDSSDGIFANVSPDDKIEDLHPGDLVRVDGITGSGQIVSVILNPRILKIGHAPLPAAPPASFDRLAMDAFDARWVTVDGIVRSVQRTTDSADPDAYPGFTSSNLILTLVSGQDRIDVITVAPVGVDYRFLVDAQVRLRAAAGSRFNERTQPIAVHLFMPDIGYLQVTEPAVPDPFSLPVTGIADVMRFGPRGPGHRLHVRGVVTSVWGTQFSIMDPQHGIFVHTDLPAAVALGDVLDIVGFPSIGRYTTGLDDALFRRIGAAPQPAPFLLTASSGLGPAHDAEPVQIDGDLLYISRAPAEQTLLLNEAGITFSAVLPTSAAQRSIVDFLRGTRLRITGIALVDVTPTDTPSALHILLRSPADIVILQRPSWWTASHTLVLAIGLAALVFVVTFWNAGLRRRVRAQTRVILSQLSEAQSLRLQAEAAHQEKSQSLAEVLFLQGDLLAAQEELRYQATHDVLTGLWNRAALLDQLRTEIERSLRTHATLGILMLDVDHFKPVNDTFGHLAGDTVLKEIAQRISRATRTYDIVGRYGGEEFVVILPSCDREQTESSAERIRTEIGSVPFIVNDSKISLTVSIGATVAPDCAQTETEILSLADLALYQAKGAGRNCTILRTSFEEEHAQTS